MSVALQVQDLVAGYEPGLPIVRGVSLSVAPGEILVLLGPNGAGKSTLVKAVAGLVPLTSGIVQLGPVVLTGRPAHDRVRDGLAFVPQTDNVFAGLTVAGNLAIAAANLPRAERAARLAEMYTTFPDLLAARRGPAGRLSGGQRQMLAVARAMVVQPSALVLDEPSAGLSPLLVTQVMDMLRAIRDRGVAVLLVEQNARAALAIADRALVLAEGCVAHEGAGDSFLRDPRVAALYLGGQHA